MNVGKFALSVYSSLCGIPLSLLHDTGYLHGYCNRHTPSLLTWNHFFSADLADDLVMNYQLGGSPTIDVYLIYAAYPSR